MADLKSLLNKVADGHDLDADEAAAAFEAMMAGEASDPMIAGFLMALRSKGETIGEIAGAARAMRAKAARVEAPEGAIDIVGTGGDAKGTYNISTCSALVVAGAGVVVAKHGNRAISSRSGSGDVLEELGVRLGTPPENVARCLREARLGFMFAPAHHSAMKHVMPARKALGVRTIFNLLGPLTNPAGVKRQIMGVFDRRWVEPLAHVLKSLGSEHVWVVHGSDGMDELTTTGESMVAEMKNGEVRTFTLTPEEAGLARARLEDLQGGDARENAAAIRALLRGEKGPFRDVVLLNSAAALIVAGKAADIRAGVEMAARSIDSGAAGEALEKLAAISNQGKDG